LKAAKKIFIHIIHSAAHFAAHGLCCPGGQPPLAHPLSHQLRPHVYDYQLNNGNSPRSWGTLHPVSFVVTCKLNNYSRLPRILEQTLVVSSLYHDRAQLSWFTTRISTVPICKALCSWVRDIPNPWR